MPIPSELTSVDQWVVWRYERRNGGKPTKVPYQINGKRASSTDPATWTDYESARAAADEDEGIAGVGFVVSDRDDFVGIDIDHCYDATTNTLLDHAAHIIRKCASYTEISPSGAGIRIICRAHNAVPSGKSEYVEVYPTRRFLTITGNQFVGTPNTCRHADEAILFALRWAKTSTSQQARSEDPTVALIKQAGLYLRYVEPGIHEIKCPWSDTHTGGDISGTKWLEANYNGYDHSTFHCHHAHCASHTTTEFLRNLGSISAATTDEQTVNPWFWVGGEIFEQAPAVDWVIDGWMTAGTVSLLYGKKDSYKSFVSISAGMSVAAGVDWYGHKTAPGGFAYLCGEGRSGIAARMQAWASHHGVNPTSLPLFLGKRRMRLDDEAEVSAIAESLAKTISDLRWPNLRMLIIDTLSSSTPSMDENDAAAMATAIDVCKNVIAERFGCAVLIVHHAGKDVERGARGSSSIEGNAESVMLLKRKDDGAAERVELECKHIKDAGRPVPLLLGKQLQPVGSGTNLVFVRVDVNEARSQSFWAQSGNEKRIALDMFREGKSINTVLQCLNDSDIEIGRGTVQRWREAFIEFGDLRVSGKANHA